MKKKTAVVLFNLGGPDTQKSVRPFLFNLFNDAAIINLSQPFRGLIAALISLRRTPVAKKIYAKLGGGSPILKNTKDQAEALEALLNQNDEERIYKVFIGMRYWKPFIEDTVFAVRAYGAEDIVLLPLYPQFSTTTTGSSIDEWDHWSQKLGSKTRTRTICCYPQQEGFIESMAGSIRESYTEAQKYGKPRILFSAHGLPEKIILKGDPYQMQCKLTVDALLEKLDLADLDQTLCFQSRVGPMKWIGPSTEAEILRAGKDKVPLVVVPIAFVSEHSETLVEIDIEYRHLAREKGVPHFIYVPTASTNPAFIEGLASLVRESQHSSEICAPSGGVRICPMQYSGCLCNLTPPQFDVRVL